MKGPDGRAIWDKIRDRQLSYQVIMPGSFDEVADVLAAADAFVLPSYQEGMSLSLLEAMAANLSVVATDIPGNRDLIQDENGWLCQARNPGSLAESILNALQKQAPSNRHSENARRFVTANYSLEKWPTSIWKLLIEKFFRAKRNESSM